MKDVATRMPVPKLIYVMGIDGSGKSTVSEHLAQKLREQGYTVNVEWLRFNHVLSKPLLGLCRLIGLTRYETHDGIRVGYHDFHRSRMISWLFVLFQYLDAMRVKYFKIMPGIKGDRNVLILDRYVYDILVDVMVDTGMDTLHEGRMGRAFLRLLPPDTRLILVNRELDRVLDARPEGRVDQNFIKRYRHYQAIAAHADVNTIDNNGPLADLLQQAESVAGLSA
jgi:thymidylate kinase